MKTFFPALTSSLLSLPRPARLAASLLAPGLLALGLAGCASSGGMETAVTTTADGPRGRTPAEERVIAGVADLVLVDRAWPDFDQALPNRINTVGDGAPLYVYIRTNRPLQELAHPADPNASAAFARYPYLLLQVGDTDSMRIVNTCYVTLTPEEGRRTELVVPLAPMVRRPGNSPTDCWLATVASQPPGRLRQEIRLAGFAGKFERWLPVPDILAVAQVDADLTAGSALYSAMLRSPNELMFSGSRPSPGSSLGPIGSSGGSATPGSRPSAGPPLGPAAGAPVTARPQAAAGGPAPSQSAPPWPASSQPPSTQPASTQSSPPPTTPTATAPPPVSAAPTTLPSPGSSSRVGVSPPAAGSAPVVIATPVPGLGQPRPAAGGSRVPVRSAMGGERLEAQLQALAAALLGRRPSETFFIDNFWVPAADQRGQFNAEQAFAAAVFRGSSCSWARLRVLRRPGGANIADIERAGDFQDVSCDSLR